MPRTKAEAAAYARWYRTTHPALGKGLYVWEQTLECKTQVLARYGKGGRLQCCWELCEISDVDMLTIDHVADNGAEHRRQLTGGKVHRCGGGINLYRRLRRQGYPKGYQTLCHNHQWKKEILRRARRRMNVKKL